MQENHGDDCANDGQWAHYREQVKKDRGFFGGGFRSFHLTWILSWFGCSGCRCDLV